MQGQYLLHDIILEFEYKCLNVIYKKIANYIGVIATENTIVKHFKSYKIKLLLMDEFR